MTYTMIGLGMVFAFLVVRFIAGYLQEKGDDKIRRNNEQFNAGKGKS